MSTLMDQPFAKSTPMTERCHRLFDTVPPQETLGIVMSADPDAIASALALKRLMWRRVRHVALYHVNAIERSDNLALIKLLNIKMERIRSMKNRKITHWAMVDSQPGHYEPFMDHPFDIIIDHHPLLPSTKACFLDIRERYGANSTIMTEYLRSAGVSPSPGLATALFYGIKTDTDNFVRDSLPKDINAFRYLYPNVNMNIIKKIESSEFTIETLDHLRLAMKHLIFVKDIAFVYMKTVANPDELVIIADFLMKLAEAHWSVVGGIYEDKLIVILRNADLRADAGKQAQAWFNSLGAAAGGHRSAARAEIPLKDIEKKVGKNVEMRTLLLKTIKGKQ